MSEKEKPIPWTGNKETTERFMAYLKRLKEGLIKLQEYVKREAK
jgi:hypothetical protein